MKWNAEGGVRKKSNASVKRNSPSLFRLKKMRDRRGEPILPRWLYSPLSPSVKCRFWKLYIAVSVSTGMMSPNVGSTQNMFTSRGTPRSTTVLSRPMPCPLAKPCWFSVVMLPPKFCPSAIRRACWACSSQHRLSVMMMPTNSLRMASSLRVIGRIVRYIRLP